MATHEQAGSEPCRKNTAPCGREDSVGEGRANLVRRRAAGRLQEVVTFGLRA